ncbi:hypothetical protein HY045_00525 [Candidatus Woesebacteria bacterium]|nr:hypothetical protein [Candidatus Woesebacteria bacterium]
MNKFQTLSRKYYLPYDKVKVAEIFNELVTSRSENQRKILLDRYSPFINILKDRFKNLVYERNKLAQIKGFNNFFDYVADWDKVPARKLENFLKNAVETSQKILDNLPEKFKEPAWLTGNYNNLNFYGQVENMKIRIPDDVFEFLIKKINVKNDVLSKIVVQETNDTLYSAEPEVYQGNVIIKYSKSGRRIEDAIGFSHECGHAIELLSLIKKNIKPTGKPSYYHEEKAVDIELRYAKSLSRNIIKARVGNFLYTFANSLFEHEIYNNPDCDYEVAYANSRNNVCRQLNQIRNPFYVFNTFLVEYPCYSTIYSVIYNSNYKNIFVE